MGKMRFRYLVGIVAIVFITLFLSACRSAPAADPVAPTAPTAPPEPTATEPAPEPTSPPAAETSMPESAAVEAGERQFEIVQAQSEARFLVDEVLLGADKTVVGATSQITGAITVDPANPSAASISPIIIDARSLATDSSRRNRSIHRRVLGSASDEFRYITFAPTAIKGIPESIAIGETLAFSVTGDLTVRGVTRPETFALTVTPHSETELSGLGRATVLYADYEIAIPEVPAVASVEDKVRLEIEFVAAVVE